VQARLLHGLLEQLDIRNPVLVGHSWSGSVVLAYLLAYPDSTSGGVLLAGGTHPWEGGVAWYNDLAGLPVLGDLFAWTLTYPAGRLMIDAAIEEVFDPNAVTYEYRARTGIELSLRPATFLANAEDVRRLSDFLAGQSQRCGQIERPLLLLTGREDEIVPSWNHADRLQKQVKDVERIDFVHTGHALHHVHPERVANAISRFAARQVGEGKAAPHPASKPGLAQR
jgi:pimeloyl-ACP methyl ester carboxylesterase